MTMTNVDAGNGDRLALAVLVRYRMATTEQMHLVIAPGVRIEQTRRRLAKLRTEGLVDRITLPRAGRTRVWFPTEYGTAIAGEWPELRGRPPKKGADPTAVRLRVGHGLTVTETALCFLQDARHRGDLCPALDWIPEIYHPVGNGEAVIPDALVFYRHGREEEKGSMLRAFVEVDRATMGPERPAAKLTAYERLHRYAPVPVRRRRSFNQEPVKEEWRQRYPLFPRLLFVLDGTGPTGIATRINALHAATGNLALASFLRNVPVLAAPLVDLLRNGPSAPVWRPSRTPTEESAGCTHCARDRALRRPAQCPDHRPDHGHQDPDHGPDHCRSRRYAAGRAAIAQPTAPAAADCAVRPAPVAQHRRPPPPDAHSAAQPPPPATQLTLTVGCAPRAGRKVQVVRRVGQPE
ncbi:replication-relaxation family protein [Streptomyces sp. NPDC002928]|uniref:replication-relaxation family protein n=1 Tax=Streptomyces sp. NPDC002928 TaxID=3154440 RepID=UPI0033AA7573